MKEKLYLKILTLLEGTEQIEFKIDHDQCTDAKDITARLEEKISNINKSLENPKMRPTKRMVYEGTRKMFQEIIDGDKPNEPSN